MLASRSRNLYVGVTNNLSRRLAEHRQGLVPGFTSKYRIFRLVWYEIFGNIEAAIAREKEIKAWRREKKLWLIEKHNPFWRDLAAETIGGKGGEGVARSAHNADSPATYATADPSPPSKKRPGSG
jgi:putative endonuclease